MMSTLRAFCLAGLFLGLTLLSAPIQWLLNKLGVGVAKTYPHTYHRFLCHLFGIRVHVVGKPIDLSGALIVANHTSYFDIVVLSAAAKVSFVAKQEVKSWPLFGLMASLQGSIFVNREKRSATAEASNLIRDRLKQGDTLVLFPEGTTADGNHILPFKSALMGAVEAQTGTAADGTPQYAPVQPVSIAYVACHGIPLGRENRPFYAWYGDMDLASHVMEAFKTGPLDVVVEFHAPLTVGGGVGRKQIAIAAENAIRAGQLRAIQGDWGPETTAKTSAKVLDTAEKTEAA